MIAKYNKIFRNNIISYIQNRIYVESRDSIIADEVMSRFPVWIALYGENKVVQKEFIVFLVYGIRQSREVFSLKGDNDGNHRTTTATTDTTGCSGNTTGC